MGNEAKSQKAVMWLRILLGVGLVWQVLPNLDRSFVEGLPDTLDRFAEANPFPMIRWGLHHIVAPNIETLGTALSVGQLLVGSALCIGFFTRFSAFLGFVYAASLFFMGAHLGFYHQSYSILLAAVFATVFIGDAGCNWGVDGFLFKHKTDKPEKAVKKLKIKDKKQKEVIDSLSKQIKKNASKKKKSQKAEKA
jgi:uncharacterized membrane protein YphA (DoxX/SURF4 family)